MSRNRKTRRRLLLGSVCVLLLAPLPGSAREPEPAGSYANIEKRKEKIDQLQDLLRIRKAELQLEQLALERENLRRKAREPEADKKPAPTKDSTTLRPALPPPRPAARLAGRGRLVEIFDDLVVIKIGKRAHKLRKGGVLQGWRLQEIGPDFVRLHRRGQNLQLDLALPSYTRPLSAAP